MRTGVQSWWKYVSTTASVLQRWTAALNISFRLTRRASAHHRSNLSIAYTKPRFLFFPLAPGLLRPLPPTRTIRSRSSSTNGNAIERWKRYQSKYLSLAEKAGNGTWKKEKLKEERRLKVGGDEQRRKIERGEKDDRRTLLGRRKGQKLLVRRRAPVWWKIVSCIDDIDAFPRRRIIRGTGRKTFLPGRVKGGESLTKEASNLSRILVDFNEISLDDRSICEINVFVI